MIRCILIISAFSMATQAIGQSNTFYRPPGGGSGKIQINTDTRFEKCSILNTAKPIIVALAQQWAIGTFNGALMYGPFQNNPITLKKMNALDVDVFWANILVECKNSPDSKLTQAVQRVMDNMIFKP